MRFAVYVGVATLSLVATAQAGTLGLAQDYNGFFFSNFTSQNSDTEGRLAVGGNFNATSYAVGEKAGSGTNLVVKGNTTLTGGTLYGSTVTGGTSTIGQATVKGNLTTASYKDPASAWNGTSTTVNGTIQYTTSYTNGQWYTGAKQQIASFTVPVDFAAAKTALTAVSNQLAATSATGTVTKNSSTYTFTGTNAGGANYFTISAAQLALGNSFILNLPTNATPTLADDAYAIINVTGATAALGEKLTLNGNAGWFNATSGKKILWNLTGWDTVEFTGSFNGSVLATGAAIQSTWGQFNGTLIADSFTGPLQLNNFTFDYPSLPELGVSAVPIPLPAAALGASILLSMLSLTRRRA